MRNSFDMNLESLKKYLGASPTPNDFDNYWQKSIKEANKIVSNYKIKKTHFFSNIADCYDMFYTSIDNIKIHTKMIIPKNKEKMPCIINFHGLNCDSGEWTSLLPFASEGYCVFSMDCRGQGGGYEDSFYGRSNIELGFLLKGIFEALSGNIDKLYYRNIILDAYKLYTIISTFEYIDKDRMGVTGWSQGGALTVALAALVPGIKCIAPVHPYLSDYKRFWQLGINNKAYEGITNYFRIFDPHHKTEDQLFKTLSYIDIKNMAKNIKANVFFSCGLKDTSCPPSTQFAVFNQMKCKKYLNLFHDFDHEILPTLNDEIFTFFKENL